MTAYERVLRVLDDGAWHRAEELRLVTRYPEEWIKELRHEGHEVRERKGGGTAVRLRRQAARTPRRLSRRTG